MRKYKKIIDGKTNIKERRRIILVKDGKQIINPTPEMLIADGWEVYTPEIPNRVLSDYIKQKKEEVLNYDSSSDVNQFTINGIKVWLDKATRSGLMLRFQSEQAAHKHETTLWYDGMEFVLPIEQAIQMLYAIEVYASACYDNTQKHLSEIDKLETIEEVEAYDYRKGYPEKLRF